MASEKELSERLMALDAQLQAQVEEESILESMMDSDGKSKLHESKRQKARRLGAESFTGDFVACGEISLRPLRFPRKCVKLDARKKKLCVQRCPPNSTRASKKLTVFIVTPGQGSGNNVCIMHGSTDTYMCASTNGSVKCLKPPISATRAWNREASWIVHPAHSPEDFDKDVPRNTLLHRPVSLESRGKPGYYLSVDRDNNLSVTKQEHQNIEWSQDASFFVCPSLLQNSLPSPTN